MSENKIFIFFDIVVLIAFLLSLTMLIITPNPLTIILFILHIIISFFFLAITIQIIRDSKKERIKNVKKR